MIRKTVKDIRIKNSYSKIEPSKNITKNYHLKNFKKWFKFIFLFIVLIFVAMFLLIKINPSIAANIADNYLRPLIGDKQVIFIENILFNVSDNINRVIYKFKQPGIPQFFDQTNISNTSQTLDITPIPITNTFKKLQGEGVWNNLSSTIFPDTEVMADTFIRPDPDRSFAIVSIVQMDTKLLGIAGVAGTKEPGGSIGNFGPGVIPKNILDNETLIASFNGSFLYVDGKYGMIVGDKTYVPLKINMGTIAAYKDGSVKIFNYTGDNLGKNLIFARQGGPLIVDNGEEVSFTSSDYKKVLGRVVDKGKILPGGVFTWRSGLGITKTGNLIYAVGNSLGPESLAKALYMAGAVNAIQLDINTAHVNFYIFSKNKLGGYSSIPLNKDLKNIDRSSKYFTDGSQRDFFYLYKR